MKPLTSTRTSGRRGPQKGSGGAPKKYTDETRPRPYTLSLRPDIIAWLEAKAQQSACPGDDDEDTGKPSGRVYAAQALGQLMAADQIV